MKKRGRYYLALAVTTVCLLSTMPVHASIEGVDLNDTWPESTDGISYVIDFVDQDGEILDSRICTYGERLRDIIVPGQRETGGHIYQFMGWEPEISETVTESMAYMAVYQRIDGSDDESTDDAGDPVLEQETKEAPGLLEKAASLSLPVSGREQVSSTSYDVTPFHIESSVEKSDLPDGRADDPAEDFFGYMIPEDGVFERTDMEEAGHITGTVMVDIWENVEVPQLVDLVKEEVPDIVETADLTEISAVDRKRAEAVSKEDTPAAAPSDTETRERGAVSVETVEKPSMDRLKGQELEGADLVAQKSFPLAQLLCSIAVGAGGAWVMKGVQEHALFRKRR